jgi:hypothetical protein
LKLLELSGWLNPKAGRRPREALSSADPLDEIRLDLERVSVAVDKGIAHLEEGIARLEQRLELQDERAQESRE